MTINTIQHRPHERHLHAEELSSRESLPDVKAKQKPALARTKAEVGIDLVSHAGELCADFLEKQAARVSPYAPGAGAIAAPLGVFASGMAQLSAAHTEGEELKQALQRDAVHTATLHLGTEGFGAEYKGYVDAEMGRMTAEYAQDDSSRALYSAQVARTVTAVIKAEGGNTEARASVAAGVRDGIDFAKDKGLRSAQDIDLMKRLNPQFRARYETDATFHHGVDAVVWKAENAKVAAGSS